MSKYHTLRDKKPSQERIYELVRAPIITKIHIAQRIQPGKFLGAGGREQI